VGLERGPPSLVSTTEELLGRKSSDSGLESREYGRRDPSRNVAPSNWKSLPTSGGRSVGRVRSRTQATELFLSSCKTHEERCLVGCNVGCTTLLRTREQSS
jgi:hypothetical protein